MGIVLPILRLNLIIAIQCPLIQKNHLIFLQHTVNVVQVNFFQHHCSSYKMGNIFSFTFKSKSANSGVLDQTIVALSSLNGKIAKACSQKPCHPTALKSSYCNFTVATTKGIVLPAFDSIWAYLRTGELYPSAPPITAFVLFLRFLV